MNKTTIVIFVFLIAAAGGVFFYTQNSSGEPCDQEDKKAENQMQEVKKAAEEKVELEIPQNLTQCSAEIFSSMDDCFELPEKTVCGYDHTIYEDGSEKDHGLDYKTACHYCNFFGEDGVKDMMGTKVEALGYVEGKCP